MARSLLIQQEGQLTLECLAAGLLGLVEALESVVLPRTDSLLELSSAFGISCDLHRKEHNWRLELSYATKVSGDTPTLILEGVNELIYQDLRWAEARVHEVDIGSVKLEGLGSPRNVFLTMLITDILEKLSVTQILLPFVLVGRGIVSCEGHPLLPNPPPVTQILLRNFMVKFSYRMMEETTPSVLAILRRYPQPNTPPERFKVAEVVSATSLYDHVANVFWLGECLDAL